MQDPSISIIVPLYNEKETFSELTNSLNKLLSTLVDSVEILFVDDGSNDGTSAMMKQIALSDSRYHCIFLSKNFGHQLAITAGLKYARATKGVMIMDGDLQDPPELIHVFLKEFAVGYEIIYSIRKFRKESFFSRLGYWMYYRIFNKIANLQIPIDSGDFCFLSRRVVDIINSMPEEQRYLRGMRAWVGFSQKGVEYERFQRFSGKSKYSFSRLLKLAFMGIFNFSEFPIKIITILGVTVSASGFIYFILTIIRKFFWGDVPSGFTALIGAIVIFSGVQLISIGILGEYIVRIFYQVKQRPLFVIKERILDGKMLNEKKVPVLNEE